MQKLTGVLVRISRQLKEDIQRIARKNRRPQVEEHRIAFENHVLANDEAKPLKK
jgi:hypothetical protein